MVVRATLDNPLPNGGLKTFSDVRCLCVSTALTNLLAPLRVTPTKYWVTSFVTQTTLCISSVVKFAQSDMLGKQVISAEE